MGDKSLFSLSSPCSANIYPGLFIPNHGRREGAGEECEEEEGGCKKDSLSFGPHLGDFCFSSLFLPCAAKQIHTLIRKKASINTKYPQQHGPGRGKMVRRGV